MYQFTENDMTALVKREIGKRIRRNDPKVTMRQARERISDDDARTIARNLMDSEWSDYQAMHNTDPATLTKEQAGDLIGRLRDNRNGNAGHTTLRGTTTGKPRKDDDPNVPAALPEGIIPQSVIDKYTTAPATRTADADDLARTPSSIAAMSPAQFKKWDKSLEGMDPSATDWYTNEVHQARYLRRGTDEEARSATATARARNAAPKFREWTSKDGSETRQYLTNWKGIVGIRREGGTRQSPRYYYPGGESAGTMERAGAYVDQDGRVHITGVSNSDAQPDRKEDMQLALQAAVNKARGTNERPYGRVFDAGDYPATDGVPAPEKKPDTPAKVPTLDGTAGLRPTPDTVVITTAEDLTADGEPTTAKIKALADYLATPEGRAAYDTAYKRDRASELDAESATVQALLPVMTAAGVRIDDISNYAGNITRAKLRAKTPATIARNLAKAIGIDQPS
jgi:hypothetical protein